ncbi:MAG: magnesium transporter [bacterium]
MDNRPDDLVERLTAHLTAEPAELRRVLEGVQPADVASAARSLDDEQVVTLLKALPEEFAADVLVELGDDAREEVLERLTPREIADAVEEMDSDDAADVVAELEQEKAVEVVELLEEEDRREITTLLTYPEDTAGGIMQLEIVSVREDRTVARAIEKIRLASDQVGEDFSDVFVVSIDGKLVGRLPLPRIILADPSDTVRSIMDENTLPVQADLDQEAVAQLFKKYDLTSAPVVGRDGVLLGRITVDDVVDVMHDEAAEDYSRLAGTMDEEFEEDSVLRKAMLRLPWLVVGLFGGVLSAFVFSRFEENLTAVIALAFFVPVITAMGGNVAIQSSAVMVRALATEQIRPRDAAARLAREVGVSIITGMACAGFIFATSVLWWGDPRLGAVVSLSMMAVILISTSVGAFVPLAMHRVRIDPALATGPFVTTSNDVLGIVIYLSLAGWILRG